MIELRGKPVSDQITSDNIKRLKDLSIVPKLAVVRVGDSPDDIYYENSIVRYGKKIGANVLKYTYNSDINTETLLLNINKLNSDDNIHGIIVLRPLPTHLDYDLISKGISPSKDIDAMNPLSLLNSFEGKLDHFLPSTAKAVLNLLDYYKINLKGKLVTIINRSDVIGKPLSLMMLHRDATVTVCHSKTKNLKNITRSSDIVISGIGKAGFLGKDYFSKEAIVIDVGMSLDSEGKISGDVKYDSVLNNINMITPVPGGVGSVTTATLFQQMLLNIK